MKSEERAALIEKYKQGYAQVEQSLEGFLPASLTSHPIEGKWSAAEIVHHLADSEMTSAIRLRKLLVEEHPVIYGYDEAAFSVRLAYNSRDIAPSLEAFQAARTTTSQLLDLMTDDDWKREGFHTESGVYSTEHWLRVYADHAHNHAAQIRRLREALSK